MDINLKKFEQLKATGELPSPKGVALNIVRLAQRDDVNIGQLEQAIKADPAFVGRLMKTANITGRKSGRPIASVPDAINVLGVTVVRRLALGFSLVSGYRCGACTNFDYSTYWTRAVVNALALQSIIQRTNWANPEEAFCCGLLADVGKLALATVHPEEYSGLLGEFQAGDVFSIELDAPLLAREEAVFALHHDDLTAAMLTDWGFPRVLLEPIYFRRRPERSIFAPDSRGERLMGAARLADAVVDACLATSEERQAGMKMLTERAALLDFEPEELESIVNGVTQNWREWAKLLQLDPAQALPSFAELAESDSAGAEASKPLSALRVLLAANDALQRKQLFDILLTLGCRVFEAENGEQALELALTVQPHILLADWAMPELDGLRLTRALRDTRLGREIYVLLLADGDKLVEAVNAGADGHLSWPVNEKVLEARLRAGIRVVQLHEEVQRDQQEMRHFAAELAVSNRRLHEASVTDALTGFYNRRYAMDRLDKDWSACDRTGRPLSCMMIDLDNFKQINDTHGHDVGDKVLVGIADLLRKTLRSNDVICRFGGDEFLVISPDTDAPAVLAYAERLRAAVEDLAIMSPLGTVRCGLSIGVATRNASMVDTGMLIKKADEGMYRAKLGGRARVGEPLS